MATDNDLPPLDTRCDHCGEDLAGGCECHGAVFGCAARRTKQTHKGQVMNRTKYTPGPWKKKTDASTERIEIVGPHKHERIAEMVQDKTTVGQSNEVHANAYLIAAAPNLLAACMEVVRAKHNCTCGDSVCGPCTSAYEKSKAAVRKAVGSGWYCRCVIATGYYCGHNERGE